MDPRERDMLRKVMEMTEENHKMIKKMRRTMRIGFFFKLFYWVIIIGAAIGAFYFAQPYIDQIGDTYSGFEQRIDSAQSFFNNFQN